ncbi:hypothetical protein [Phenylobacterium sp.]|uniref:hypothetical protein n=1 Tax=Phenylobacterium sp. TaxID=1871053 RepID=UPI00286B921B|nr:hypothetical protein [Phenylobacterium sp.]
MTIKLLLAGAAAVTLAFPAMAQVPAATPSVAGQVGASVATPPVNPDPMKPATDAMSSPAKGVPATQAQAETGMAANVSATEADLKTGATVTDATGAEIGKISKVTKKADGGHQVTLSANGKTVAVPATSLSISGGALVSSESKTDIWGAPK